MSSKLFLPSLLLSALVFFSAQKQPLKGLPKAIQEELADLQFIPGGKFTMGGVGDLTLPPEDSTLLASDAVTRMATVSSFLIGSREVTNAQWQTFYQAKVAELGPEAAAQFYPDTSAWQRDFPHALMEPISDYYAWHPSFADYPVVGLSVKQVEAYCQWRSQKVNAMLKDAGLNTLSDFRLPTEAEWEYAAQGGLSEYELSYMRYPWGNDVRVPGKGENGYLANFGSITDNYGLRLKSYMDDGGAYTTACATYPANNYGLYDMAGNVGEWVAEVFRPSLAFSESVENLNPLGNRESKKMETPSFSEQDSLAYVQSFLGQYQATQSHQNIDTAAGSEHRRLVLNSKIEAGWRDYQLLHRYKVPMRITKGGSWAQGPAYMLCGARAALPETAQNSWTGFRVAMTLSSNVPEGEKDPLKYLLTQEPSINKGTGKPKKGKKSRSNVTGWELEE